MTERDATPTSDVAAYLDVVAERSLGSDVEPIEETPGPGVDEHVVAAQDRLAHAEALAHRRIELPRRLPGPTAREVVRRLAQVSVTHQLEVNRELIGAQRALGQAISMLERRIESLRGEWQGSHLAHVGAGVASLRSALDDLAARTDELAGSLVGLDARTATLAEELAARRASAPMPSPAPATGPGHEPGDGARSTATGPGAGTGTGSGRTPPAELAALLAPEGRAASAAMRPLAEEVIGWLGDDGTLLDLASGRGRWLGLLAAAADPGGNRTTTVAIAGWEVDPTQARIARDAGHHVAEGSWADALAAPGAEPCVVSAIDLAPRLDPDELDTLVRRVAATLEPGGTLVVVTPRPDGTVLWLDPAARRPVPGRLVEALALAAGFTEVASRFLDGERVAVVARGAGGRPPER